MKLAKIGEFALIERIRQAAPAAPGLRLGIGDDCAAMEIPPGELLLTSTDLLIEDVHFRRKWCDWRQLGRKSVAVNVSDIAAMGGIPRAIYLALGLPAESAMADIDAFIGGFLEAAGEYGAVLAGGDTCRSPGPLLVSVTVEGSVPAAEMVTRGGARPDDMVYVSGTLGDSALALRQLAAGETPHPHLALRHHEPTARVALGRALAAAHLPTAMIDLSDGLLADLGHLLTAANVGAEIEEIALPLSAPFRDALRRDPQLAALPLTGGEDYELLFTAPPEKADLLARVAAATGVGITRIGRITAEPELRLLDREGRRQTPARGGYDHFAG
ncbi:MAG: thiamine-phosphate kinase [Desulfuromonadales bacterium]|jgi:thiamine-monophosphate kinase